MKQRNILYGYRIENGKYIIDVDHANIVGNVFDLYLEGMSYEKISRALNKQGIIYLPESPVWNKHIIKRILENPKYKGNALYPCIILTEKYDQVQALIATKSQSFTRKQKTAEDVYLQHLSCGKCRSPLPQLGGRVVDKDIVLLKCRTCGAFYKTTKSYLHNEIVDQINAHTGARESSYVPSSEALRLEHIINRYIEQPDDPSAAITAIMDGINARYQCCNIAPVAQTPISRLTEMTSLHFGKTVSSIIVSNNDNISVQFK